jgi:hypothetical protein
MILVSPTSGFKLSVSIAVIDEEEVPTYRFKWMDHFKSHLLIELVLADIHSSFVFI